MIIDSGMSWLPSAITVTAGTTVTWAWVGFHSVISNTNSEPYSTLASSPGSFSHTFNTPGTFDYQCGVHGLMMSGKIYVTGVVPTQVPSFAITPGTNGPIVDTLPVPNPGLPSNIYVLLDRSVDSITIKIYSKSMVMIDKVEVGPQFAGWTKMPLPASFLVNCSTGTYYYVVEVERQGTKVRKNGIGQLVILK